MVRHGQTDIHIFLTRGPLPAVDNHRDSIVLQHVEAIDVDKWLHKTGQNRHNTKIFILFEAVLHGNRKQDHEIIAVA